MLRRSFGWAYFFGASSGRQSRVPFPVTLPKCNRPNFSILESQTPTSRTTDTKYQRVFRPMQDVVVTTRKRQLDRVPLF